MKQHVRTWFDNPPLQEEKVGGISVTQPDQAFSLREILHKFTNGGFLPVSQRNLVYDTEGVDLPDFKRMDLAEIEQFRDELYARLDAAKKEVRDRRAAEQKAKDDADFEAKFEQRMKERGFVPKDLPKEGGENGTE